MGDVIIDGGTGANRLVVLDVNGKIPALDGSAVTNVAGANFSTGTIPTARLDTGTTAGKIVKLDGNAKLPAVSGAALTGVAGASKNSSDPTISTNPSGGVGSEWHNTTTGEVYICTDATAGANVWKNVGGGLGGIPSHDNTKGGTLYAFWAGGLKHTPTNSNSNTIERMAFASSANATDVGDLSVSIRYMNGASSSTHGYIFGGSRNASTSSNSGDYKTNKIAKFAFAASTSSTDIGDLTETKRTTGRGSVYSATFGYCTGGDMASSKSNKIEKTSFSSDGNASAVGDLVRANNACAQCHSEISGYSSGGHTGSSARNEIEKFNFASDGNSVDWADLLSTNSVGSGASGTTHGYVAGGNSGLYQLAIQKFAYASDVNASYVGELVSAAGNPSGATDTGSANVSCSTTHGYRCGASGGLPIPTGICRWSFSSDGDATDVGDVIQDGSGGGRQDGTGFED
jgi:hypothetical protein